MSLFDTITCCSYSPSRLHWTWPQILLMTNMKVAQRKCTLKRPSVSKFDEAWKIAEQKAKSPKRGLNREHSDAMHLFTNNKPKTKSKSQSF